MNPPKLSAAQEALARAALNAGKSKNVYRRAAALLAAHQGMPISRIADLLGVTRQSVYNWISAYGAENEKLDFEDAPRCGRPSVWTSELDAFVHSSLDSSPQSFGYAGQEWTIRSLGSHLQASLQKKISHETLRKRLGTLGYAWKDGRYVSGERSQPLALASAR